MTRTHSPQRPEDLDIQGYLLTVDEAHKVADAGPRTGRSVLGCIIDSLNIRPEAVRGHGVQTDISSTTKIRDWFDELDHQLSLVSLVEEVPEGTLAELRDRVRAAIVDLNVNGGMCRDGVNQVLRTLKLNEIGVLTPDESVEKLAFVEQVLELAKANIGVVGSIKINRALVSAGLNPVSLTKKHEVVLTVEVEADSDIEAYWQAVALVQNFPNVTFRSSSTFDVPG